MNEAAPSRPSEAEIIARARAMVPMLSKRAAATETLRRVPDETNRAFRAAGFYKIMQPRYYGGYELAFGTQTELGLELARGCGSSAWVAAVIACHGWLGGMFPAAGQDEMWGRDPDAAIASSFFPVAPKIARRDGGLMLSGRWRFSSGVDHCQWAILLVPMPADAGGEAYFVLVPLAQCRIEDVWHAVGLAGTGSNDIILDEVFVPAHRLLDVDVVKGGPTPGSAVNDHYLYRLPALAPFTFNLVGTALGLAHFVAESIVAGLTQQRTRRGAAVADYQSIQLRVAEGTAEIEAASALVFRARDDIIRRAQANADFPLAERVRYRRDVGWAALTAVRAVERLFPILGAQGLMSDHPVQRAWRDLHAISHHFGLSWDIQGTLYGSVALGLASPDPRL